MVGLLPLAAVTTLGPATLARLPDFTTRVDWFTSNRPEAARRRPAHGARRSTPAGGCSRSSTPTGCGGCSRAMLDEAEFLSRPRPARALEAPRGSIRSQVERRRRDGDARLRARRVDERRCSAATRTGAGRCGSRSTTCSIEALRGTTATSATTFTVEYPTGSGQQLDARRGRRRARRAADRRSSCADDDGRRPVFGELRAASRRTRRGTT